MLNGTRRRYGRQTSKRRRSCPLAFGFKDVNEMRRWDTEQGQKVFELENKLRTSESDARNFQWHVRRMMLVLEKVKEHLMGEGTPRRQASKNSCVCKVGSFIESTALTVNTLATPLSDQCGKIFPLKSKFQPI